MIALADIRRNFKLDKNKFRLPVKREKLDNYCIVEEIGRGNVSIVYGARTEEGEKVAIKVLQESFFSHEHTLERFLREFEVAQKIRHPNITNALDFGVWKDNPYMVMEFLEGKSLFDYRNILKGKWGKIKKIVLEVCKGLQEMHKEGLVHRDIKPANIIIENFEGEKEQTKLIDFNLACVAREKRTTLSFADWISRITAPEDEIGTPNYSPPQQFRAYECDASFDTYSLGVMIHFLYKGILPFFGDTSADTITRHSKLPPNLRYFRREGEDAIAQLLRKALSKDSKDRFKDAKEFANAIEGIEVAERTLI
ncbi:MAG: serine/threonine-protein kinase [Candidatus Micrarchaeota archaeon]